MNQRSFSWLFLPAAFSLLALAPSSAAASINVVAFGDSITYGAGNPGNYNWTDALQSDLPKGYSVVSDGISGATMEVNPVTGPSFQASTNQSTIISDVNQADIVLIMLGTNDSKNANQAGANANYLSDYKSLLNEIVENDTKTPLIYLMTPTPAFLNNGADQYDIDPTYVNGTMKSMVESLSGYDGARVIDLNDELASTFSNGSGGYSTTYLQDGIHPTIAGDLIIGSSVASVISVPEPSAICLMVFGAIGIAAMRMRIGAARSSRS